MSLTGLGIDFNAPPSPPSLNPAIARLQGRPVPQRRPLPHVPLLRHAISLDNFPMSSKQARFAHDSPEVIGVEEDYGNSDDERYMEDEQYDSDNSPPQSGLSKSISYQPAARLTAENLRRTLPIQRPRSMMEMRHVYAMQAQEHSSDDDSPSPQSGSSPSPTASSMTSISPSEPCSNKLPVAEATFVPELPSSRMQTVRPLLQKRDSRFIEEIAIKAETGLTRQGTLLSNNAEPSRRQRELNRLLAPGTSLKRKPSTVVLEQANSKGKARVELDVVLASSLMVEGGVLKGKMEVSIKEGGQEVWVLDPKARVVGFEELPTQDARHVFYHHAAMIETEDSTRLPHTSSAADGEGFHRGMPGKHSFPFQLHLPVGKGAKGPLKSRTGTVRYIVIGSMKLKAKDGSDRSIAHFYRHIDVFPYFDPAIILASLPTPRSASTSQALFMGGSGKVHLTASLHRLNWVAGQRCYIDVVVKNETSKKARFRETSRLYSRSESAQIKSLSFALLRTMSIYHPQQDTDVNEGEQDGGHSESHRKKVAEETLEMGKRGAKGEVTAKGMWMGVEKGETIDFSHSLLVPAESLSIARGRHLEVSYALKVSLGAGPLSSDVSVELPVEIVNFISIDPPPGHRPSVEQEQPSVHTTKQTFVQQPPVVHSHARPLDRMASMDSLQVADLNAIYRPRPLERHDSVTYLEATVMSRHSSQQEIAMPQPRAYAAVELVERARARQLKHQMSLECIGNAIASATARRLGQSPPMSILREEMTEEDERPVPTSSAEASVYATPEPIQSGESDEDDCDPDQTELEYPDESTDEVEAVMRNFALEDLLARGPAIVIAPPPVSPIAKVRPLALASAASPRKSPGVLPYVPTTKSPRQVRVATPSSPIKRSPSASAPLTSPKKATPSPHKVARVPAPAVRRAAPPETPSPDLTDSEQTSPSTEDAVTPPSLRSPPITAIVGQQRLVSGMRTPPHFHGAGKAAPGVTKRVTALETRQNAIRVVSGRVAASMARQPSVSSIASSAFAGVDRHETPRMHAPILRH